MPYNIAHLGSGRFHRGTGGQIAVQGHPSLSPWVAAFTTAGLPLKVDAICGAVVRLAEAHGLKAPRNARMVELLIVPRPQTLFAAALRQALAR